MVNLSAKKSWGGEWPPGPPGSGIPKRHSRKIDKLTRGSWNKHDATAVRLGFNEITLSEYTNFEFETAIKRRLSFCGNNIP